LSKYTISITNIDIIAKQMTVNTDLIATFLKKSLNCHVITNRGFIVAGHCSNDQIESSIKELTQFILCKQCSVPELDFFRKEKKIGFKCRACGAHGSYPENSLTKKLVLK
jgi:translation initiation factor 2 beta subunit (eIF-2beta)/eIF-5